ncbi:MAG: NfeD family protein [Bdellovibrionales bacterium]|nr:NfeD family protein [Bdellovibrionales bacterium]
MEFWQSFWLIFGVVLIIAEVILPGGIAFFIGFGALFVGGLYFIGVINDPLTGFTIWFILSITFLFTLKGLVDKFLPHTETKSNTDEDIDAFGEEVEVLAPVSHQTEGRIRYQGTSWPALSRRENIEFFEGDRAIIVFRNNMTWLIDQPDVENTTSNEEEG